MRTLSEAEQEDRKRKLLQAIIHQFIKTAKPVGSVFLAEQYNLDLSSATIRNVMAELENEGYLTHPHTSAGRVPTEKAYRFYVDSLVELQRLAQMEEERIRHDYEARIRDIEQLMQSTSKTLSALSNYTAFVLPPKLEETKLRHLELVAVDSYRVLVVLVSDTGIVKQRLAMFDHPISPEMLASMARLLNEQLRGRSFTEVRDNLRDHIDTVRQRQMDMMELARQITEQAFGLEDGAERLYLEGTSNILSLPDFQDQEQMRSLINLLDEKRNLGEMIVRNLKQSDAGDRWKGVSVKIGAEAGPDWKDLSLISSVYSVGDRKVGVLGIIGPKRMEYSRMINLVSQVASAVSGVLGRLVGTDKPGEK